MSDAFDDDDDFFSNPAALESLAQLEAQAIATQATATQQQQRQRPKYHHTVVRPAAGPRAAAGARTGRTSIPGPATTKPPPRPLNTNPRVSTNAFGHAGKTAAGAGARPNANAYASSNTNTREALFLPAPSSFDDEPPEVVVNDQGQYGRPEIKAEPPQTQHQQQQQPQQQQRSRSISTEPRPALPGSQARREAIEAAARTLPARGLQRSTSSVSTGAMGGGGGLTAGPSRMLSRSISTGQQVFQRAPRTSTSGALSPIPQSSQSQESAGATARRTALALEAERVRLEAADAEIAALRSRVQEMSGAGLLDVAKLQRELYAAQGQVQIVRDNQAQEAARFREDIRRLKEANNGLEQAARDKEAEYKTRLESMRTQAVFSNHSALASASKMRQSQYMSASQATPLRMGSPLKSTTPAMLRMAPPPPPRFESLANAFNATPTVKRKRQPTEPTSPVTTPKKQRMAAVVVSPAESPRSQGRSQSQRSQASVEEMYVDVDWQPDLNAEVEAELEVAPPPPRDERAELAYHLGTHQTLSDILDNPGVSTLVRIGRSHVPPNPQWRQWDELANELLCVWSNKEVDTSAAVMAVFAEMLAVVEGHDEVVLPVILVLRLAASTIFLFPSLVAANHDAARSLAASLASLSAVLARKDAPAEMGDAIAELAEALCLANVKRTWTGDQLSVVLVNLVQSANPLVVARGVDLFAVASCYNDNFQPLLCPSDERDVPVIDSMARLLAHGDAGFSREQTMRSSRAVLGALMALSRSDQDAVVLLTGNTVLTPALMTLIHRESTPLWSMRADVPESSPAILLQAITLLHHLVHPTSVSASASDDGAAALAPTTVRVDIVRRLQEHSDTKEWHGVQQMMVVALGAMTYADGAEWGPEHAGDLQAVQDLASDLLEEVVEGPDLDSVYEVYATVGDEDEPTIPEEDYEEELMLSTGVL